MQTLLRFVGIVLLLLFFLLLHLPSAILPCIFIPERCHLYKHFKPVFTPGSFLK